MLSAERESGDYDSDKGIYCGYAGSGHVFLTEVFPESHPFNGGVIDFLLVCGIIIEKEAVL